MVERVSFFSRKNIMGVNERLTDRERVELTKKSYEHLQLGDNITIGPYDIGTVCRVEHAKDGMSAFVISSPSEITILFKGDRKSVV